MRPTFTAFTQSGVGTIGTAGGSLTLFIQPVAGNLAGSQTNNQLWKWISPSRESDSRSLQTA